MKIPFFGKAVGERYTELANSLARAGPEDYIDPITLAALRHGHRAACERYSQDLRFIDEEEGTLAWRKEAHRLVVDGYVLGRVESSTERQILRFSRLGGEDDQYEFAIVAAKTIQDGVESGKFSGPPRSEISELLVTFALEAGGAIHDLLVDDPQNIKVLGEANGRTVNVGRELALMEDVYLNPKKRGDLHRIQSTIRTEARESIEEFLQELRAYGHEVPHEEASLIMDRVMEQLQE